MSNNKRPRGRPRKYATSAERKKAYRERKKVEYQKLGQKVKLLEAQLALKQNSIPIPSQLLENITLEDLSKSETGTLKEIAQELQKQIPSEMTQFSPVEHLLRTTIENEDLIAKANLKEINIMQYASSIIDSTQEILSPMVILILIENELSKRENHDLQEYKLQLLENRIKELEKESIRKKELIEQKQIEE